jgi:hypothetical protein
VLKPAAAAISSSRPTRIPSGPTFSVRRPAQQARPFAQQAQAVAVQVRCALPAGPTPLSRTVSMAWSPSSSRMTSTSLAWACASDVAQAFLGAAQQGHALRTRVGRVFVRQAGARLDAVLLAPFADQFGDRRLGAEELELVVPQRSCILRLVSMMLFSRVFICAARSRCGCSCRCFDSRPRCMVSAVIDEPRLSCRRRASRRRSSSQQAVRWPSSSVSSAARAAGSSRPGSDVGVPSLS